MHVLHEDISLKTGVNPRGEKQCKGETETDQSSTKGPGRRPVDNKYEFIIIQWLLQATAEAAFRKPLARGCAVEKEVMSLLEPREVGEGRGSLGLT